MGHARTIFALLSTLNWRPRLAALIATIDACDPRELTTITPQLVELLRECAAGRAGGGRGQGGAGGCEQVMHELVRRWTMLPPYVRHDAIDAAAADGTIEPTWTGVCVQLAADTSTPADTKLGAVACAADCGEPEAAMLLATLVANEDRAIAQAAQKGLLTIVERSLERGAGLVHDEAAHETICRAVVRAVEAHATLPRAREAGGGGEGKGIVKAFALLVGTPGLRAKIHEQMRIVLDDTEHPLHRQLSGMLRRDTDPRWRTLAWTWLGSSTPGEAVIGGTRACMDRLGAMPAVITPMLPASHGEHAGVLHRSHLALNPARDRAIAEHARRGNEGVFGKWLPAVEHWSELTDRQRLGVLDLSAKFLRNVDMEKLQPDVELLWYAALADSSSHVRHRLVRLLADADTRLSRDVLADAAFDADERVATSAVLALGQSINNSEYDVQNIERLANVCAVLQRSPHEKLRHLGAQRATAIEAWGVSRSPASSSHARLTARRAAQHDPAHAREAALRRMEQWPDRPIEAVAAARTAESAGVDVLAEFFELTALLLDFPGDERRHEHAHALADAAKLLAHAHARRRDELLGACVVDSDPRVRANAVESLGTLLRRGSVSIGGYLGTLLDDTNSRVRANAAVALSRSSLDADIDSGVHAIDSMLRDGRPAHRIAGLWALGAAAAALATSRSHMPALVSLGAEAARLAKADPDQSLRWRAGRTAAMVLVLLKTPSHMPHAERPPIDAASPSYSDLRIAEVAR